MLDSRGEKMAPEIDPTTFPVAVRRWDQTEGVAAEVENIFYRTFAFSNGDVLSSAGIWRVHQLTPHMPCEGM